MLRSTYRSISVLYRLIVSSLILLSTLLRLTKEFSHSLSLIYERDWFLLGLWVFWKELRDLLHFMTIGLQIISD